MKLVLTKHAFERYCERGDTNGMDYYEFENHLRTEAEENVCFLEWQCKPAVYLHQAYWRYELDTKNQEITLVACLGILEFVSVNKRVRQGMAKSNRYTMKFAN